MPREMNWSKLLPALVAGAFISGMPLAASAGGTEPFAAGAQITEVLAPSADPACQSTDQGVALQGTIHGTGLGTAIGPFTASSVDCLRSSTPGAFYPPLTFTSKSLTLTAANGDQILASYSGNAELSPVGLLVLKGTYTITGGTGAFRKAKGSGTLAGVEDISTVPATGFVSLVGQISY